jgi:FMN phosphatase YigB (HAD superfamily)
MSCADTLVFLLDVDNTLLDNDRFAADLGEHLAQAFGASERQRYWTIYDSLRDELGYADYLASLQRFREGLEDHPALLRMSAWLLDYPFAERLYPHALEIIAQLRTLGRPVILSDGDVVFQPRKIARSGLWDACRGEVLIYRHKQQRWASIEQRYPASHYVMVDDKPELLASMKQHLGARLSTVFVQQGHYAAAAAGADYPAADLEIARIDQLGGRKLADLLPRLSTSLATPSD